MVLLAKRRLVVPNEPEHNLGVDEAQRVHDLNRRARGAVRVPVANHSSRLYPAWSHNLSSVAILCAMIAIRRRDASVADTYHMPEFSAATRKARALLRPSGPMEGSSTRSKNPCALLLSHPSDMDSTPASRYKNGKGFRIHATSVSVNKTEHPLSTNSWMMRNFCAEILCDPRASLTTLYDATPWSVRRLCRGRRAR